MTADDAPRRCWHAAAVRGIGRLLGRLSPARLMACGRLLARLPGVNRGRRRIAARNIALCFPELDAAARRALVCRTLADNSIGALDTLRAWFAPRERLGDLGTVQGLEHLRQARAEGHGVVVVGAHYESIEMAMRLVAEANGRPMPILVRRYNDPCLEREIDIGRCRYAGRTYDKKDIAGFAAAVQAGEAAFYVPDQNASRRHVFVPFYGVAAATLGVLGGVLRRTGGRVLLMWCRRGEDGRYRIDLEPAWPGWPGEDETANAARYMRWIEDRSREAPSQYLWVHRRFKTRPPGEPGVY